MGSRGPLLTVSDACGRIRWLAPRHISLLVSKEILPGELIDGGIYVPERGVYAFTRKHRSREARKKLRSWLNQELVRLVSPPSDHPAAPYPGTIYGDPAHDPGHSGKGHENTDYARGGERMG